MGACPAVPASLAVHHRQLTQMSLTRLRPPSSAPLWRRAFSTCRPAYADADARTSQDESFESYADELKRRKRKADYKRRQHVRILGSSSGRVLMDVQGQSFLDHVVVTVRGGESSRLGAFIGRSLTDVRQAPAAPAPLLLFR